MSEKTKNKRLVLLDAHAIIHRAYHALPEFATSKGEPTGGLYGLSAMLIKIIADLKPDYLIACYDLPKPTYRHEAYKEYKAGRAKADPELISQLKRSREIFEAFNVPIYDKEGFEADDILGTIVEKVKQGIGYRGQGIEKKEKTNSTKPYSLNPNPFPIDVIIASGDMDTLQLVDDKKVQVYTLKKGINDTVLYDEEKVVERFGFKPLLLPDYKGLRGDPSDNIIGVKGIGEKTATDLIKNFGSIEDIYKKLGESEKGEKEFAKAGIKPRIVELLKNGKEEAEFSKVLATIRRDAPIDFVLPEKSWAEAVSIEKVEKLFAELEFRTLGARLKEVLRTKMQGSLMPEECPAEKSAADFSAGPADPETALALWLVSSNLTNPTEEDIKNFSGAGDFASAKKYIFAELEKKNLRKVFDEIEKPLIPIVEEMEKFGVKIDSDYLKKLSLEYHAELSKIEKEIWKLAAPYTKGSGTENFNVSSPKQLGVILFEKLGLKAKNQKKTAGGALSTRESELEKMRELHPIIPLILQYRELEKLLGTYIDTIPAMLDASERLHAKFIQAGTTTGRMSSEKPNLQNIPNHTELGRRIRHGFVADKGNKLVSFDYSQIELRIAAFLSGDEKLIKIFKNGEDVHTAVASYVFKVAPEKVDKEMRRRAKVINFGIIYGMGVLALMKNLGTSREEAQNFLSGYFEEFSGLAKYLEAVKEETRKRGYTETFFGRRRYFEGLRSPLPYVRAEAERMAINAPIQGTEADIVKLAMIKIFAFLREKKMDSKVHLILQVHDELVYEMEENLAEKIAPEIKKIMENILPLSQTFAVPILADVSVGLDWGDMKKI